MKKRIISAILVVVMLVLSLASCGAYDFSEEDLSSYVTVDYDKLIKALGEIEIEDGEFGATEGERQDYINDKIYDAFAKKLFANAEELDSDKLKSGAIGAKDIVFFSYYATDADGNVFYFENMNAPSNIGTDLDKVKSTYFVNLASLDDGEELANAIAAALVGKNAEDHLYAANGEKGKKIELGDTIVVSYKREFKLLDKTDATKEIATINQTADYEVVKIASDSDSALGRFLAGKIGEAKTVVKINSNIEVADGTSSTSKPVVEGLGETYDHKSGETTTTYDVDKATYSEIKVLWEVESKGAPIDVTFTPFEEEAEDGKELPKHEVKVSTVKGNKVDLTNKELTYHVYPVFYLDMPEELSALNILEYVTGSDITLRVEDDKSTTNKNEAKEPSFDIFEDEAYAEKVKTEIEKVKKLYAGTFDTDSVLETLSKAYTNAEKAYKVFDDLYIAIPNKDAEVATVVKEIAEAKTDAASAVTSIGNLLTAAEKAVTDYESKKDTNPEQYAAKVAVKTLLTEAKTDLEALKTLIDAAATAATAYTNAEGDDAKETAKGELNTAHLAAYDKAEELEEKWSDALDAAEQEKVYAKRNAVRAALEVLVAIKPEGQEKTLGEKLYKEYREDEYESAEHSYKEDIIKKVNEEIYKIVFESDDIVKVNGYPEEVVDDYYKNLYESYEHDFYTGKALDSNGKETSQSNYSKYGNLHAYLYEITEAKKTGKTDEKEAIEAAIIAEAKELVAPVLKLYAVAKALDAHNAGATLKNYYQADIDEGVYNSTFEPEEYEYDDSISEWKNNQAKKKLDKQNEKNKKTAEENAQKNKDNLIDAADNFIVDKDVYKAYKKSLGSVQARQLEEYYGEINLRAILQTNRLFDYLTHYEKEYDTEEKHADAVQTTAGDGDAKTYTVKFSTVKYTLKAD